MFQNRCNLYISFEDAQFAKKALCTPGMVDAGTDLIIGEGRIWDGSTVEARLCGVPGKPARLAVAVFDCKGGLMGHTWTQSYQTAFQFSIGYVEYMIALHVDKTLTNEAPKEDRAASGRGEGSGGPPQEWPDGINGMRGSEIVEDRTPEPCSRAAYEMSAAVGFAGFSSDLFVGFRDSFSQKKSVSFGTRPAESAHSQNGGAGKN